MIIFYSTVLDDDSFFHEKNNSWKYCKSDVCRLPADTGQPDVFLLYRLHNRLYCLGHVTVMELDGCGFNGGILRHCRSCTLHVYTRQHATETPNANLELERAANQLAEWNYERHKGRPYIWKYQWFYVWNKIMMIISLLFVHFWLKIHWKTIYEEYPCGLLHMEFCEVYMCSFPQCISQCQYFPGENQDLLVSF